MSKTKKPKFFMELKGKGWRLIIADRKGLETNLGDVIQEINMGNWSLGRLKETEQVPAKSPTKRKARR